MTTRNLEQLAFLCTKNPARKLLHRYWMLSCSDCDQLREDRIQLHRQWKGLRLRSKEAILTQRTMRWGEAEIEYWQNALSLIQEWLNEPSPCTLAQAKSRFQLADQAFREYIKGRVNLEASLVEEMLRQSPILL